MPKPKSLTHRIVDAVDESDLPLPTRALLRVMAYRANNRTGVGWYGQETLARWVGCSLRTVRDSLATLAKPDATPIRIERRARFARGRGRTSDEWRLVLVADQPAGAAGYTAPTNRQELPVTPATKQRLTGKRRTTNRQMAHDQPAGAAGDPLSDPLSDPRSTPPARGGGSFALESPTSKEAPKKTQKRKPKARKAASPEGAEHKRVVACYFDAFRAKHQRDPIFDAAEGTAVKRLLGKLNAKGGADEACRRIEIAFQSFRAASVTIRDIASKPDAFASLEQSRRYGRPAPQQTAASDVAAVLAREGLA